MKNKKTKPKEDLEENVRVFIDIKTKGNASGGIFLRSDLKETVEKIEKDGVDRVVGVVYDGTYNLEIVTQPIEDMDKLNVIEGDYGAFKVDE